MTTQPPELPASKKDRSGWIVATGIVLVLLGLLCGAIAPLMIVGTYVGAPDGLNGGSPGQMIPGILFQVALAAVFLTFGIGIIRKRKWARDLTLALAWLWLANGILTCLTLVFMIGTLREQLAAPPAGPPLPSAAVTVVLAITIATTVGAYVVIPGLLAFFLSRRSVVATFRERHSAPGWTDPLSTPVLVLFLLLMFGGLLFPLSLAFKPVVPIFGALLVGAPAALLVVTISAGWLLLASGIVRLRPWAWWGTTVASGIFWISMVVTLFRGKLMDLYVAMGLPEAQLAEIKKMGFTDSLWLPVLTVFGALPFIGLLLWVRKDFLRARDQADQ